MSTRSSKRRLEYDIIEPIGKRVVIRKDENKRETKSGIVLPDSWPPQRRMKDLQSL
jgi:co-chaperonin GroES (HSP10)